MNPTHNYFSHGFDHQADKNTARMEGFNEEWDFFYLRTNRLQSTS